MDLELKIVNLKNPRSKVIRLDAVILVVDLRVEIKAQGFVLFFISSL